MINPKTGPLSDEKSLTRAAGNGAVILSGLEKIDDVIKSLV
jgi:hypothetical protein